MSGRSVFRHNPILAWREIDGEIVIISPEDNHAHELNPTATFVWNQMDGHRSLEEVTTMVAREFEVTRDSAASDVLELAAHLEHKRLLLRGAE